MLPSHDSLLRYQNPVAVTDKLETNSANKNKLAGSAKGLSATYDIKSLRSARSANDKPSKEDTEDLLNRILPPREWVENDQRWVQKVSSTPATRSDVSNMQDELDIRLQQRQAKETGICPIRRDLYSQCFDELIRQITINCSERGLMLLRVRNEISMSMAAYQALYESSIAFGIRKALQSEEGKSQMIQQIEELKKDREDLLRQVEELKAAAEQADKRNQEQRALEEKKHSEEIQFLKKTTQQLKTQLMSVINPKQDLKK